jgi:hypothetical protein
MLYYVKVLEKQDQEFQDIYEYKTRIEDKAAKL